VAETRAARGAGRTPVLHASRAKRKLLNGVGDGQIREKGDGRITPNRKGRDDSGGLPSVHPGMRHQGPGGAWAQDADQFMWAVGARSGPGGDIKTVLLKRLRGRKK